MKSKDMKNKQRLDKSHGFCQVNARVRPRYGLEKSIAERYEDIIFNCEDVHIGRECPYCGADDYGYHSFDKYGK